jgi:hypothetical protein
VGSSAGKYKFDASDKFWSANGGTITSIMYAVISMSNAASTSRHLLCYSQLSTAIFSISAGNRMTVQMAAAGILNLA